MCVTASHRAARGCGAAARWGSRPRSRPETPHRLGLNCSVACRDASCPLPINFVHPPPASLRIPWERLMLVISGSGDRSHRPALGRKKEQPLKNEPIPRASRRVTNERVQGPLVAPSGTQFAFRDAPALCVTSTRVLACVACRRPGGRCCGSCRRARAERLLRRKASYGLPGRTLPSASISTARLVCSARSGVRATSRDSGRRSNPLSRAPRRSATSWPVRRLRASSSTTKGCPVARGGQRKMSSTSFSEQDLMTVPSWRTASTRRSRTGSPTSCCRWSASAASTAAHRAGAREPWSG